MDPQDRITIALSDPYEGMSDGAAALAARRLDLGLSYTGAKRTATGPDHTVDLEALIPAEFVVVFATVDPEGELVDVVAAAADVVVRVSRYRLPDVGVHTTVWARSRAAVAGGLERISASIPVRPESDDDSGEVDVHVHAGRTRWDRRLRLPRWSDIADNYTDTVHADVTRILAGLPPAPRGPRLIVIAGEPGGGKTWLCRALLREAQERGMSVRIAADPGQVSELLPTSLAGLGTGDDDEICLVEDADELLVPAQGRRSRAASSLLNASDGLVAETLRAMWLLTTNLPVGRLDPAMLRPGRTLAAVEVPALTASEANVWLRRRHSRRTVDRPAVLAELYQMLEHPHPRGRRTDGNGGYV